MFELYDKVIDWEYVRNKDVYEQINAEFIPYEENRQLQHITDAIIQKSLEDLENVTRSLGFYLDYNGRKVLTPLSQVYTNYLDNACFDIVTGAFDYGSVLRRVVTQLTNSGLRKIEYGSGYASRVEVAARRAVMTGVANLTGEITWKDNSLWYLTRPMTNEDIAETHTFQQQSNFGVFEGTVTIIESKE